MTLQLHDLSLLEDPFKSLQGVPLQIEIGLIDEDPQQPRTLFEGAMLAELASSIRERGVLQPISVRQHPAARGRWILNFGARRLRASRLASLERIPAFVDDTADDYAQVVENEQRERLKPLELALFVQRRMAVGDSQAEIALHHVRDRLNRRARLADERVSRRSVPGPE
jgi:ParB family chromosome partitioning protein